MFARRTGGTLVGPSMLAADFGAIASEAAGVLDAGADLLHLDVMDGHFVPNLTMGPDMCGAFRRACPSAWLDVHLMVEDPARFAGAFLDAGADHITAHAEVLSAAEVRALSDRVRGRGATFGLAINPATGPGPVRGVAGALDLVLVMSVWPGFGGQRFIAPVLETVAAVRAMVGSRVRVQMDGGIGRDTAEACRAAGCDVLVAGSAVFGVPPAERAEAIAAIRGETPDAADDQK